jgi:hypothetical protein
MFLFFFSNCVGTGSRSGQKARFPGKVERLIDKSQTFGKREWNMQWKGVDYHGLERKKPK